MSMSKKSNIPFQKNDTVTVRIEDIGINGEGIGKAGGYTIFIKDAVIGDVVEAKIIKAKKGYAYGRLMNILEPSKARVPAVCPAARACGGCQLQEMSYKSQLEFKQDMVRNNLERIGGITEYEMLPVIGMEEPFFYRNKAQFPVGADKTGKIVIGFYAAHTHSIIDHSDCCIGAPQNAGILAIVREFLLKNNIKPYNESEHTGLVRHILIRTGFATGQVMVCLVINGNQLPNQENLVKSLSEADGMASIMLNINKNKTNVILGEEVKLLWGKPYIEDCIGDIKFQISPLSFFQVNPKQTAKLYNKVLEFAALTGTETVWDLYCGIGTISLFLAKKARAVYGVEIIPQAIDDARNNAALNAIENVEFFAGKAEEVFPRFYEEKRAAGEAAYADVIIVDPPRKGCDEVLLSTIVTMLPQRIVYVSCDSATLARDLKYLSGNGYRVEKVQAVDQFGHTVHIECVVLMSRVDK